MARYTGPRCKLSRREGVDLQNTSNVRSIDSKCKLTTPPGMHGQHHARMTDYCVQLRMKQLLKRYYGILERQFAGYYKKAAQKKGATGSNLLNLLESRLDNVVYRMGFATTRAEARQIVNHGAILVNGKSVNIPSFIVSVGDVISVREKSQKQARILNSIELAKQKPTFDWLTVDYEKLSGEFKRLPEMSELPPEFKVHLVVELYSK